MEEGEGVRVAFSWDTDWMASFLSSSHDWTCLGAEQLRALGRWWHFQDLLVRPHRIRSDSDRWWNCPRREKACGCCIWECVRLRDEMRRMTRSRDDGALSLQASHGSITQSR
jgi:hypothetical protein